MERKGKDRNRGDSHVKVVEEMRGGEEWEESKRKQKDDDDRGGSTRSFH
jgi:hypothetical protein